MQWWWVFAAGGVGALLRYAVSGWVQGRAGVAFPWGTLSVNVLGCLLVGFLATAAEERSVLSPELRIGLLAGLLGGFTTFSTFGLETFRLAAGGEWGAAGANALGSVAAGLLGVAAGVAAARALP